jgi:LPXTG-motif cell wall-anchored protein
MVDNRNDIVATAVPASGMANFNGNIAEGDLLSQDVRSCTTLNTAGCGSDAAPDNGGIDLNDPLADLGGIGANSDTLTEQQVDDDPLRSDGNTTSNTDVKAPAVPGTAIAEFNGNVTEGDTLSQDVGVCGTLNAENCGGDAAPAPGSGDGAGIDLGDAVGSLDDTTVDSDTAIGQQVNDDPLQQDGTLDNRNDIVAPAVPASGTAALNGNAAVGDTLNQEVSSCTDLNAAGCANDAVPTPDSGAGMDLSDPLTLLEDISANNDTSTNQQVNDKPLQSSGTTISNTDVDAPSVPASAKAELDGNATLDERIGQDVSSCTSLNAAGCSSDAAPAAGDDGDADDSTTDGGSESNGSGSDNNDSHSDDSRSGSDDSSDGLAFAAPADSSRSSNSGSSDFGSGNNSDEPASAASLFGNRTQPLAARYSGIRIQSLAASRSSDRMVALAAGPSKGGGKASASSGSAAKVDRLPDTGGVSPLVLIAALLFIGGGIVVVTRRRQFNS